MYKFEKSVSQVEIYDDVVVKSQPKTMADREFGFLMELRRTGFVPSAYRIDQETIVMERLYNDDEIDWDATTFLENCEKFLEALAGHSIRHGDLTRPHVFIVNNSPVVIDWSESKWAKEPLPDKRPQGDTHWLGKTFEQMFGENPLYNGEWGNTRMIEIIGYIYSAFGTHIRFGGQWWEKKTRHRVIDLGFGYGDILKFFRSRGWQIYGVDNDKKSFEHIAISHPEEGFLYLDHIQDWIKVREDHYYHVSVCTSVLPYFSLEDQDKILTWMKEHSSYCFVEMQAGMDGPASKHSLDGQEEVKEYLETYFPSVIPIGTTWVKGGRWDRTIFMCATGTEKF